MADFAPPLSPIESVRRGWSYWWWLAVIGVAAAGVRFRGLTARELWFDENCTFYIIHHLYDWPADGPDPLQEVGHIPYFFLLQAWTRLAGETVWGMRSFSALMGCAGVIVVGLVATRLGDRAVGLISALLAALNPLHIYYSQEARGYTTWLLAITVCIYVLCRAARSLRARWWVGYAVVTWFAVLVHYYTLLWPLGTLAAALLARDRRRFARQWLVTHGVLAVALIPVVWSLVRPLAAGGARPWFREMWLGYPPALAVPRSLWAMLASGGYPRYLGALGVAVEAVAQKAGVALSYVTLWGPALLVAAMGIGVGISTVRDRDSIGLHGREATERTPGGIPDRTRMLLVMASLTLAYLAASWLYSWLVEPTYIVGRYDLAAWPSLTIAVALLVDVSARLIGRVGKAPNTLRVLATVLLAGCSLITQLGANAVPIENDLTARARRIASAVGSEDLVISLGKYRLFVLYEWHQLGWSPEVISFPRVHDRQLCWYDAEAELAEPERIAADAVEVTARIQQALAESRRVWLLVHGEPAGARWQVDQQLFARFRQVGIEVWPRDEVLGLAELVPSPARRSGVVPKAD